MKLTIDKNELYLDPEIIVKCKEIDDVLQDIISYIGIADKKMIGEVDGELFFIPLNNILYFESVDKVVYIYTDKQVYRSSAKLYVLEEQLADTYFSRVSKTTILNLKKLNSVRSAKNAKLEGLLFNKEKILISRQYVAEIKKRLGV
ncbi:MAG: LytTR family transcriptional regulator DNA-binding domain-containing protein [Clostridia bacterium]|nr:LytTR family transcriptional regulator DNA-binding domain-containing protein [Clostridia bacterium]